MKLRAVSAKLFLVNFVERITILFSFLHFHSANEMRHSSPREIYSPANAAVEKNLHSFFTILFRVWCCLGTYTTTSHMFPRAIQVSLNFAWSYSAQGKRNANLMMTFTFLSQCCSPRTFINLPCFLLPCYNSLSHFLLNAL